jgi:hypothetical protein
MTQTTRPPARSPGGSLAESITTLTDGFKT